MEESRSAQEFDSINWAQTFDHANSIKTAERRNVKTKAGLSSQDIADFFMLGSLLAPKVEVLTPTGKQEYINPSLSDEDHVVNLQVQARLHEISKKVYKASYISAVEEVADMNVRPMVATDEDFDKTSNIMKKIMLEVNPKSEPEIENIDASDEITLRHLCYFLKQRLDFDKPLTQTTEEEFLFFAAHVMRYEEWKVIVNNIQELGANLSSHELPDVQNKLNLVNELLALHHYTESLLSKSSEDPHTSRLAFELHSKQTSSIGAQVLLRFCSEGLLDELQTGRFKKLAQQRGYSDREIDSEKSSEVMIELLHKYNGITATLLESIIINTNDEERINILKYVWNINPSVVKHTVKLLELDS